MRRSIWQNVRGHTYSTVAYLMEPIRIVSYNCRGLPYNHKDLYKRPTVQMLFNDNVNAIICLQETWFTKQDLANLNALHPGFHGTGVATVDNRDELYHGHPPGGVSILWRTCYDSIITPFKSDVDWITGIVFDERYVILCVYMPYECHANEADYVEKLGVLQSILSELDTTCVSILGDWNADISDDSSIFAGHLRQFCSDTGLLLSDEANLPSDTFTHVSERWHTTSWLDHCLSSKDGHNLITNMKVQYHTSCCDHIPLTLDISTECIPELETVGDDNDNLRVNWSKMSAANLEEYTRNTDIHLNGIETPVDALRCKDIYCKNENHRIALDVYYRELVHAMTKAGQRSARRDKSFNSQPGWNEHVSGLHKVARNCFIIWRSSGKPRQGEEFELMRQTRLQFKYALRYVKQHENIMRRDSLAKKLAMSDPTKFWSEIRTMSGQNNALPSCVEGVSGMGRIAEQWRLHFEHLFNCVQDPERNNMSFNSEYNDNIVVTTEEVVSAVQKLDTGKSSGLDGIFAEHLLHCSQRLLTMLASCITGFFCTWVPPR